MQNSLREALPADANCTALLPILVTFPPRNKPAFVHHVMQVFALLFATKGQFRGGAQSEHLMHQVRALEQYLGLSSKYVAELLSAILSKATQVPGRSKTSIGREVIIQGYGRARVMTSVLKNGSRHGRIQVQYVEDGSVYHVWPHQIQAIAMAQDIRHCLEDVLQVCDGDVQVLKIGLSIMIHARQADKSQKDVETLRKILAKGLENLQVRLNEDVELAQNESRDIRHALQAEVASRTEQRQKDVEGLRESFVEELEKLQLRVKEDVELAQNESRDIRHALQAELILRTEHSQKDIDNLRESLAHFGVKLTAALDTNNSAVVSQCAQAHTAVGTMQNKLAGIQEQVKIMQRQVDILRAAERCERPCPDLYTLSEPRTPSNSWSDAYSWCYDPVDREPLLPEVPFGGMPAGFAHTSDVHPMTSESCSWVDVDSIGHTSESASAHTLLGSIMSAPPAVHWKQCLPQDTQILLECGGAANVSDLYPGQSLSGVEAKEQIEYGLVVVKALRPLPSRDRDFITFVLTCEQLDGGSKRITLTLTGDHSLVGRLNAELPWRSLEARELVGNSSSQILCWTFQDEACDQKEFTVADICKETLSCEVIEVDLENPACALFLVAREQKTGQPQGIACAVFGSPPFPKHVAVYQHNRATLDVTVVNSQALGNAPGSKCPSDPTANKPAPRTDVRYVIKRHHDVNCKAGCKAFFKGSCKDGILCTLCHHEDHRNNMHSHRSRKARNQARQHARIIQDE